MSTPNVASLNTEASPIKRGSLASGSLSSNDDSVGSSLSSIRINGIASPVLNGIVESMQVDPTLVVWCIDSTPSAKWLVAQAKPSIIDFYDSLEEEAAVQLQTAVVGFAEDVVFVLEEPTSNPVKVVDSLRAIKSKRLETENVFTALTRLHEAYSRYRLKERMAVAFVVITDEAGDDIDRVEEVVQQVSRDIIPVYVLGLPAPLGRQSIDEPTTRRNKKTPVRKLGLSRA